MFNKQGIYLLTKPTVNPQFVKSVSYLTATHSLLILHVYYHEVKSLRLIETSHNTTLTSLFGAVLTDDF